MFSEELVLYLRECSALCLQEINHLIHLLQVANWGAHLNAIAVIHGPGTLSGLNVLISRLTTRTNEEVGGIKEFWSPTSKPCIPRSPPALWLELVQRAPGRREAR